MKTSCYSNTVVNNTFFVETQTFTSQKIKKDERELILMAEVFIIGEISTAENFSEPNLFLRWNFQTGFYINFIFSRQRFSLKKFMILGPQWKTIEGETEGQTSTDTNRLDKKSVFAHPIDLHLVSSGISLWPKLSVEVFSVNALKQFYLVASGFTFLPNIPGDHEITISTWKIAPVSLLDSIREKFFTGGFTIIKKDLIRSGIERYKISTVSSGIVKVNLSLVFKNFGKFNIKFN